MTNSNHQPKLSKEEIDSVLSLYSNGQYQEAINQIKVLNKAYPNVPLLFNLVGACYKALGQLEGSVKMFETAVNIKPDYAEAHKKLGIALRDLGKMDKAIESLKNAISAEPKYVDAYYNLAITFKEQGQLHDAVKSYQKAIEINPNFAQAYNNLGNVFNDLRKVKTGFKYFEKAIEINPNFAEAHRNLGNSLRKLKQRESALACFENARKIKPEMEFILGDILISKMQLCIWKDLPKLLNELALKINNNEKAIAPFPLLSLIDNPELSRKNSELYSHVMYPKNNTLAPIIDYPKHPKIRIGYFSADFREHPLAYLTAELYELHDRDHFEVHAFSFGPDTQDELNLRIKEGVDHFHNVPVSYTHLTLPTIA